MGSFEIKKETGKGFFYMSSSKVEINNHQGFPAIVPML